MKYFRQDSWQWTVLHDGQYTTSQAAPALGLLEPKSARMLNIPRSLQKGCAGAFSRLRQTKGVLRTLEEMNDVLCNHDENDDSNHESEDDNDNNNNNNRPLWRQIPPSTRRYPFAARYKVQITKEQLTNCRIETEKYMSTLSSPMKIRMNWGNSQEATAILTVLNYFHTIDPGVIIREVGMCGAGLDYNSTLSGGSRDSECGFRGSGLILGALPDAVIEYSNRTLEVLEVKNHCPFVPTRRRTKDNATIGDKYRIREMPMSPSVPLAYIPQLMMEMMCLGDNCRSAVMC